MRTRALVAVICLVNPIWLYLYSSWLTLTNTKVVGHFLNTSPIQMRNIITLLLGMMLAQVTFAQANKSTTEGQAKINQIISDFEKEMISKVMQDTTGSFSAAIIKDDRILWSKAFGKMNNQASLMADTNTVYRIGSISKTVTAYLMLLLVQSGKITLDEPVIKYLPELSSINKGGKNDAGNITFRQLASHTAGLAREPDNLNKHAAGPIKEWENKVVSSIPVTTMKDPTGKSFEYSNIGYGILGLALSRAANKPFMQLVEEMVFRPLGMSNSFFIVDQNNKAKIAKGYHWNPSPKVYSTAAAENELAGRGYKVPNGGVFTTANDLARFAMALTQEKGILEKKYSDSMFTTEGVINKKAGEGYGLGLFVKEDNGNKKVNHGGAVAGFNSFMIFDPASRTGVILLSNRDNTSPVLEREGNILLNKLIDTYLKR
jgi:CubicO group peptidase (beta-lactamase class C family)